LLGSLRYYDDKKKLAILVYECIDLIEYYLACCENCCWE